MNVHISYKVPKKAALEKEFLHNQEKLARRLQVFRPELVHLRGMVEENSAREGFTVSLNLRLPSGQMAARETSPTPSAAIKSAFDDLIGELRRHKERLRSQHKWVRRRQSGEASKVPFEQTLAAVQPASVTGEDVSTYINANLERLQRFVERELRYRRNTGQLADDSISCGEVVDEVVATALGDDQEKPQVLGLEAWLYRLALASIGRIDAHNHDGVPTVSLDQSVRRPNVRGSDEPELQFHQADEMMARRDVIADRRISTPEQIASSDEMILQVERALVRADRRDRDAFILFAVEGFTPQEIAAISERTLADVATSLANARDRLRQTMPPELREQLLQSSRIA